MSKRKRILVAPLDWGLGYAARCIPVIAKLRQYGVDIVIASEGRPHDLLRKEFPNLEHIRFPDHTPQTLYEETLAWSIMKNFPALEKDFQQEHLAVESEIKHLNIDAVISDTRLGAYSETVPSILLIHQLNTLLPAYLQWGERIATLALRNQCNKFSECWIPDFEGTDNLAGKLSHPQTLPRNSFFIGPISRVTWTETKKEMEILVILSGTEPERTIFEQEIVSQLQQTTHHSIVVRGKPEHSTRLKFSDNIILVNSLQSDEFSKAIALSNIIVARPGYSTIMDLSFAGAKAIFIPAPQQAEQEYLAGELMKKKICYSEPQEEFSLQRSMEKAKEYSGFTHRFSPDHTTLRQRIEQLLITIGY